MESAVGRQRIVKGENSGRFRWETKWGRGDLRRTTKECKKEGQQLGGQSRKGLRVKKGNNSGHMR